MVKDICDQSSDIWDMEIFHQYDCNSTLVLFQDFKHLSFQNMLTDIKQNSFINIPQNRDIIQLMELKRSH